MQPQNKTSSVLSTHFNILLRVGVEQRYGSAKAITYHLNKMFLKLHCDFNAGCFDITVLQHVIDVFVLLLFVVSHTIDNQAYVICYWSMKCINIKITSYMTDKEFPTNLCTKRS